MNKNAHTEKTMSIPALIGLTIAYLVVIQGMTHFLTSGIEFEYAVFPTIGSIVRGNLIPVGLSVMLVAIAITWLGWWQRVWYEKTCLARWAWVVPALMLLSLLVVTDYSRLIEVSPVMVLTLLVTTLLIGMGEELMFRGIILERMRGIDGITELKAVLWMTVIFGGAHVSNLFTEGGVAFIQVFFAAVSGLFYYVTLRVSGSLLVPILLHALWDFSLFSGNLGIDPEPNSFVIVATLTNIVLAIILIVRWRKIWPADKSGGENSHL